jgi:radical SAM protein with 4Fe4S-binding SPASM domain
VTSRRRDALDEAVRLPRSFLAASRGERHLFFTQDTGACVVLNEAAGEVLQLLASGRSPRRVVDALSARHGLPRSRVERSVGALLGRLVARGFLRSSDGIDARDVAAPQREVRELAVVYLHLTSRCNLACSYCYNARWRERGARGELSEAELRALLEEVAALGAAQVTFTGGEPLLRRDLLALADHARALGLETTLLTNGMRIGDRAAAIAARFDRVIVSLDSWRREENDEARGDGSFAGAVGGVQALVRAGAQVSVRAVITGSNVGSLPGLPRFAASVLGCSDLMLALCMPPSQEAAVAQRLLPSPEEYRAALERFQRALREVGGSSSFDAEPSLSDGSCGAGASILSVGPDGDVFPCQCLLGPELRLGNVRERPLGEIHRAAARSGAGGTCSMPLPSCAKCPVSGLCTLRCRATVAAIEGAGPGLVELLCPLSRAEAEHRLWNEAERIAAGG